MICRCIIFAVAIAALGAHGAVSELAVPSGQPIAFQQEIRVDAPERVVFRFIAPEISRDGGSIDFDAALDDLLFLCESYARPRLVDATDSTEIVITLADRAFEYGVPTPEATQFIEAFRIEADNCIWEGI